MRTLTLSTLLTALPLAAALAQQAPPAGGEKSLAATLEVYVFPTAGQPAEQQSKEEAACYQWATQNTGTDPFAVQKQPAAAEQQAAQQQKQVEQATQGAGAKGAVGGAAAGALIGEIASDDAGEGAAYGAAAGVLIARRRAKHAQAEAKQAGEQEVQQAQTLSKEQLDGFRKAFSVCLEAKNYMVKF